MLVINFWGAWCGPCLAELPDLVAAQKEFGARGVQVIGVADRDTPKAARRAIEKYAINWPILMDDNEVSAAFGKLLPEGVIAVHPTTFVWDAAGRLRMVESAGLTEERLWQVIREAQAPSGS